MEKPAIISIEDAQGEIVYMRFIDAAQIPDYTEALDKMMGEYLEITDKETGQTFYTLPDYIKSLIEDTT